MNEKRQILSSPAKLLISLRSVSTQPSCILLPIKYLLLNMAKLKEKLGGWLILFNTAVDL